MTIEFTVPYPARKSAWTKRYGFNAEKHSFFHDENYMRVVISDEAAM